VQLFEDSEQNGIAFTLRLKGQWVLRIVTWRFSQ